jgi:hypothetical protein
LYGGGFGPVLLQVSKFPFLQKDAVIKSKVNLLFITLGSPKSGEGFWGFSLEPVPMEEVGSPVVEL